ncbi:MAG TPA: hypothetical protein VL295_10270 [Gemmatimonadales bacterium]|nr:hypothetical protein [Gemmatimonadales bacterium]
MRKRLLGFLILTACRPAPVATLDTRTAVPLPAEAVQAVRVEMRTMLASLHDFQTGLARHDTALMRRAAVASGLAAAADPALEPLLPEGFLRLGVATHSQFDTLANAVAAGAPVDSLLRRLPLVTANCVTCHATYRLETAPGELPH